MQMSLSGLLKPKRRGTADDSRLNRISTLLTGQPGGGFFDTEFCEVGVVDNVKATDALVITLDDPPTFSSDTHTIGLVWDDNILETVTRMKEGETRAFPIDVIKGTRLSVWLDADDIAVNIKKLPKTQAVDEVKKSEGSAFQDLIDEAGRQAQIERDRQNWILFGVGVVACVVVAGAAYAIANTKIKLPQKVGV